MAYADPPYLGCGRHYRNEHPDAMDWDDLETHAALIRGLSSGFGGWALSLSTPSLRRILPLCPEDARVGAWVKPFCSFKPGVNPAYAWEPVIFHGGRALGRGVPTVRDWVAANVTLQRGLVGAKPELFCFWLFEALGLQLGDEFFDLYPGTGAVTRAWERWQRRREPVETGLFEKSAAPVGTGVE